MTFSPSLLKTPKFQKLRTKMNPHCTTSAAANAFLNTPPRLVDYGSGLCPGSYGRGPAQGQETHPRRGRMAETFDTAFLNHQWVQNATGRNFITDDCPSLAQTHHVEKRQLRVTGRHTHTPDAPSTLPRSEVCPRGTDRDGAGEAAQPQCP